MLRWLEAGPSQSTVASTHISLPPVRPTVAIIRVHVRRIFLFILEYKHLSNDVLDVYETKNDESYTVAR